MKFFTKIIIFTVIVITCFSCSNKQKDIVLTNNLIFDSQKEYNNLVDSFFNSILFENNLENTNHYFTSLNNFCISKIELFDKCKPHTKELCSAATVYFQTQKNILQSDYLKLINLLAKTHEEISPKHEQLWDSTFNAIIIKDSIAVEEIKKSQINIANQNKLKIKSTEL